MKTENEVYEALRHMGRKFNKEMDAKRFANAKRLYDNAVTIVVFLDLSEDIKTELFGNRAYVDDKETVTDGLFQESKVMDAYWQYITTEEERIREQRKRFLELADEIK